MTEEKLPGGEVETQNMPGHWVLARLGKRVLRPGGLELTEQLLDALKIGPEDSVVELAPGLGTTAKITLKREPKRYTGVERDEDAAALVKKAIAEVGNDDYQCKVGLASETGLPDASATVLYAEAMLTMQPKKRKEMIVKEAFRVLEPGGRYGIHELGLSPDELGEDVKDEVMKAVSKAIRVGARPLTLQEWSEVLTEQGFVVEERAAAPMHLLEPGRMLSDEGALGLMKILFNLAKDSEARARVKQMRAVFSRYAEQLRGVMLVARKPEA